MSSAKPYKISDSTRKRCDIFELSEKTVGKFTPVSLELFHYLKEIKIIDFSIFFKVDRTMIEYITPKEFTTELVENILVARNKDFDNLDICVHNEDIEKFNAIIDEIRNRKIRALIQKDPHLDANTLKMFSNLSKASQMVVKGGIDIKVAQQAKAIASQLIDNMMESEIAVGTLSRMVLADPTLYDHSASVAMIAGVISRKLLRKSKQESERIALGGLYHDVGKTCVPYNILNKPGIFTSEEFEVMKTHTTLGFDELMKAIDLGAPIENDVALVALEHHEKFKGGGYPHGKEGRKEECDHGIHEYSRIVTVADVYSALLMKRVYKEAFSPQKALAIMKANADTAYDPIIYRPFENNVKRSVRLYELMEEKTAQKGKIIVIDDDDHHSCRHKHNKALP